MFPLALYLLIGALFVVLGLPLKHEKIPPNWFYGFRTRKTLSSAEIWYPVNRVAGGDMVVTGFVLILAALVMLAIRNWVAPETAVIILSLVGVGMSVWMLVHGFSVLRRM